MNQKLRAMCRGKIPVLDFDKTMARTDLPSPRGFTVAAAYAWAFDRIFGAEGLLPALGGFDNQAPGELAVMAHTYDRKLYPQAVRYYKQNRTALEALVPRGKGVHLQHAEKIGEEIDFLSELIVRAKLSVLLEEVGESPAGIWPQAVDGMPRFLAARGEKPWGIITSGHELFIRRTLPLWSVRQTELLLTDDDMRKVPLPVEQKTKPSPVLMHTFVDLANRRGVRIGMEDVVFAGDDLRTDGGLARNAGIGFVWYNPDGLPGDVGENGVEIRHIDELTEAFA